MSSAMSPRIWLQAATSSSIVSVRVASASLPVVGIALDTRFGSPEVLVVLARPPIVPRLVGMDRQRTKAFILASAPRGCCDRPRVRDHWKMGGLGDMAGVGGHSRCVCRLRSPRHRAHGVSVPSPSHHHPPLNRTDEREPPVGSACAGMRVFGYQRGLVAVTSSRLDCSSSVPRLDGRCREHATVASISRPRLKAVMVVHASRPMEGGELGGYGWRRWAFEVCVSTALTRSPCSRGVYTFASSLAVFLRPPSSAHPPHRPPSSTHLPQVPYIRPSFPRSSHSRRHSVHVWSFAAISMSRRDVSRAGDLRFHHASTVETATDTTL